MKTMSRTVAEDAREIMYAAREKRRLAERTADEKLKEDRAKAVEQARKAANRKIVEVHNACLTAAEEGASSYRLSIYSYRQEVPEVDHERFFAEAMRKLLMEDGFIVKDEYSDYPNDGGGMWGTNFTLSIRWAEEAASDYRRY